MINVILFSVFAVCGADDFNDCLSECVRSERNGRIDDANNQNINRIPRHIRNSSAKQMNQIHHNNPFVFKCELNAMQKICVST